jgi:excisionase family DNA binding protein
MSTVGETPRPEGDDLQNVAQAQRTLGQISRPTLYRLIRNGEIAVVKIGSRTLFRPEDLRDFIDQHVQRASGRRVVTEVADSAPGNTGHRQTSRRSKRERR